MGDLRPGHAAAFRERAERLRGISRRLTEQAARLAAGSEQSYLLGQAHDFEAAATAFEADAALVDRVAVALRDRSEGRTVFLHPAERQVMGLAAVGVRS